MTALKTELETYMAVRVLADVAASISELKANPMKVAGSAYGEPVAILNRNEPAFYCVPATVYEQLMDKIEDLELLQIVHERKDEESIAVNIDDL
jgi:antitoxin StbD